MNNEKKLLSLLAAVKHLELFYLKAWQMPVIVWWLLT